MLVDPNGASATKQLSRTSYSREKRDRHDQKDTDNNSHAIVVAVIIERHKDRNSRAVAGS